MCLGQKNLSVEINTIGQDSRLYTLALVMSFLAATGPTGENKYMVMWDNDILRHFYLLRVVRYSYARKVFVITKVKEGQICRVINSRKLTVSANIAPEYWNYCLGNSTKIV
jgi:hypothetical protein